MSVLFKMNPLSSDKTRERLVEALKLHQQRLQEVLDSIERRDMSPQEVRGYLEWVVDGLKDLRKKVPSVVTKPGQL